PRRTTSQPAQPAGAPRTTATGRPAAPSGTPRRPTPPQTTPGRSFPLPGQPSTATLPAAPAGRAPPRPTPAAGTGGGRTTDTEDPQAASVWLARPTPSRGGVASSPRHAVSP